MSINELRCRGVGLQGKVRGEEGHVNDLVIKPDELLRERLARERVEEDILVGVYRRNCGSRWNVTRDSNLRF